MNNLSRDLNLGIAVLAMTWPMAALADCVDTRRATAAETEFFNRSVAALVAALPPAPVGGKLQNKDSLPTLGQQCQGVTGDFTPEVSRAYEWNNRKAIVSMSINLNRLYASTDGLSASYGSVSPKRSAELKVNNVVWRVSGSDSPLRATLVDAIDRARLQGMVGKPLPTVAQSEALAAQAVPATVAGAASASSSPSTQTATQPANSPAPAASGQTGASDTVKDAADTVNKLRGLFGR